MNHIAARRKSQGGFTMLEVIVVLGILVLLANLVVGKLDILQLKANKGIAVANMTGVARYVSAYRSLTLFYPDRWDSLCKTDGTFTAPGVQNSGIIGMDPQSIGAPAEIEPSGSPHKIITSTIKDLANAAGASDDGALATRSIQRVGISTLMYDDGLEAVGDGTLMTDHFAKPVSITALNEVATINPNDDDGKGILQHLYGDPSSSTGYTIPGGKFLIIMGLGKFSTLVGATTQSALLTDVPFYTNTNQLQFYNRYLVIFEVDTGGGRARMVEVVGGDADQTGDETGDYYGDA